MSPKYRLNVDLSGIIFVVLAVAWAGYLIPKALKHHDEVARTRSIDRFSTAMRVLARREPVNRRDARLVVTPARTANNPRLLVPSAPTPSALRKSAPPAPRTPTQRPQPAAPRVAARAAARRRRRLLGFLLLCDVALGALAWFLVVPRWSVAIPVGLTLFYLVLIRTQVRHAKETSWSRELAAAGESAEREDMAPRGAARVEAPLGTPAEVVAAVRNDQGFEEFSPNEDTMSIPVVVLDAIAVPTVDGGSLWDPLPVTLPTYVTKPKAKRTVRTIDLTEPGTWTSGHTDEDTKLVQEAAVAAEAETAATSEGQRAVGS